MAPALTSQEVQEAWSALVAEVRTAVLLTMRNDRPFGSHVPYVFGSDWTRAYCISAAWHYIHSICRLIAICRCSSPNRTGRIRILWP